ncbi:unnamed protein product [Porites evermanni]|uniref:Uncharacterized protein n=1 Tax=Porites evermanni TaxID=104178 RepID=A0ABN8LR07_9CNID|nr:unnamed protein product [Porites evermanni]
MTNQQDDRPSGQDNMTNRQDNRTSKQGEIENRHRITYTLVISFVIMSSKKNSRKRLCPGCKLAAPAHAFGLLNKFCTEPGTEESEDGAEAIDTTEGSPISAQYNPVQPTAKLLQAHSKPIKWCIIHQHRSLNQ